MATVPLPIETPKMIAMPAQAESDRRKTPREALLQEAINITTGSRNTAYGNPEDNFANIAAYWSSYLTQSTGRVIVVSSQDVAHMMILMKVARLSTNPAHYDSLLDIAGYAACGADCQMQAARLSAGYNTALSGGSSEAVGLR